MHTPPTLPRSSLAASDTQGVNADGRKAEFPRFPAELFDFLPRGVGLQQRVIDE